MRSIIGMRKLSVLPVPVEAVARMSWPSSAGGMALAWTGVGMMKPAAVRRALRESEMLKSVKWTSWTSREAVSGSISRTAEVCESECGGLSSCVSVG